MLPCVCSVIDHRWRQNVVRTKKWHTRRSRVCHWCSYHNLTSSVIYYCIRRTATWNIFVYITTRSLFYFKIFQHNAKAGLLLRLWVAPLWMKTYSESENWAPKSTNLEENAGKIKSVFAIGAALGAEKLGRCPENYRSWKNTLGKLVVTVNLEMNEMNERSVNDGGDFCLLWLLKSAWYSVGDSF